METTLNTAVLQSITESLRETVLTSRSPTDRQPIHTVYGGAHLFRFDTIEKLSRLAAATFHEFAPSADVLANVLGLAEPFAQTVYDRVAQRLKTHAIEDYRVDYEDGYGSRSDADEDGHAVEAASAMARAGIEKRLPASIGIRIKPITHALSTRSLRTLDLFLTALRRESGDAFPRRFVVTLPKTERTTQVAAVTQCLTALETQLELPLRSLQLEIMIEHPRSIVGVDGRIVVNDFVQAAAGRCSGVHFGAYDYMAICQIPAHRQSLLHPACDMARHLLKLALADSPVFLSDGATHTIPIGPHRSKAGAVPLTTEQVRENHTAVHQALKMHYDHVRHALTHGFYQGWDLHPAQVAIRYAATTVFFLEGATAVAERLRHFLEQANRTALTGNAFDDAASGQGLVNFFVTGIQCGALTESEARALTGLITEATATRSPFTDLSSQRAKA